MYFLFDLSFNISLEVLPKLLHVALILSAPFLFFPFILYFMALYEHTDVYATMIVFNIVSRILFLCSKLLRTVLHVSLHAWMY